MGFFSSLCGGAPVADDEAYQQQRYQPPTVHQQHPASGACYGVPQPYACVVSCSPQHQQQGYHSAYPYQVQPPAPLPHRWVVPPLPPHPAQRRRKALLVSCTYPGSRAALRGPANDSACMHFLLTQRLGVPPEAVLQLRDDEATQASAPAFVSTRANICAGTAWLLADARPGDALFLPFSGHGGKTAAGDTILPTDHATAGELAAATLAALLVQPLPPGVILHAVFDSCHSGRILELPYETRLRQGDSGDAHAGFYWKTHAGYGGGGAPWVGAGAGAAAGGTVLVISACKDKQVAADTSEAAGDGAYTGAATTALIEAIERGGTQQTYAQLLGHMVARLRDTGATNGGHGASAGIMYGSLLGEVFDGLPGMLGGALAGYALGSVLDPAKPQLPVISCNAPLDLHNLPLMM